MPRITRISGSLAIVLIAYWAYALVVVPWVEPPAEPLRPGMNLAGGPNGGADPIEQQMASIKPLFKPTDWEVGPHTKVLESDRGAKLLLKKYTTLGDGKVKLEPCTIVYTNDASTDDEAEAIRQSIILQAPEGAILQFDHDIDLKEPREAKLIGGQLLGKVTIRSDWKQPGPEDDLWIETSNVLLTNQSITTPDPVAFRWGPNFGNGRNMLIELLAGRSKAGAAAAGLNITDVKSFELRHINRLHLDLGNAMSKKGTGLINRNGPEGASHKLDLSPFPTTSTPVEIICRGPFRFDKLRRVATFSDDVHIVRPNPDGEPDQLACELLSLWFVEREKGTGLINRNGSEGASHKLDQSPSPPAKSAPNAPGSFDLALERLEAHGNPVVLTAPSEDVAATARQIEYNLLSKSIKLDGVSEKGTGPICRNGPEGAAHKLDLSPFPTRDGDQPVFLRQGPNEIHARSLHYQSAKEDWRLGQLDSQGPGWLHAEKGTGPIFQNGPQGASHKLDLSPFPGSNDPKQQFEATWQDQLRIQPRQQFQEISLTGAAELKSPGVGQLQANRVFFWLTETPPATADKNFDLKKPPSPRT